MQHQPSWCCSPCRRGLINIINNLLSFSSRACADLTFIGCVVRIIMPVLLAWLIYLFSLLPMLFPSLEKEKRPNIASVWLLEEQCFISTLVLWLALLILLTVLDISSAFVFMIASVVPTTGRLMGKALEICFAAGAARRFSARSWPFLLSYMASLALPSMLMGCQTCYYHL